MRFMFPVWLLVAIFLATVLVGGCASSPTEKRRPAVQKEDLSHKTIPEEKKKEEEKKPPEKQDSGGEQKGEKKVSPSLSEEERKQRDEEAQREKEATRERYFDGLRYVGPAKEDFRKGIERYFAQGCEVAIKEWREALSLDKDNGTIAYNIGLCYERLGKRDEAWQWYEKAVKAIQMQEQALYNMVLLDERKGTLRPDDYRRLAEEITDIVVRNNFLAWLYLKMKNYDECIRHAKMVLKEDEMNVDAMVSLGTAYFHQDMLELADMIFSTAEQINPHDFRLQRIYGFLEYKKGNRQKATEHFQKAKRLNPELPEVSNMLAVLAMEIEDFSTAKKELEFALKISPDFKEAKLNLAIVFKGIGEYKRARDILLDLEKDRAIPKEMQRNVVYDLAILYLDNDVEGDGSPSRFDTATQYLTRYLSFVDKQDREEQKRIADYVKEAQTEKKKVEAFIRMKEKLEAKRKKDEEEDRLYQQLMKDLAEAKSQDTVDAYTAFLAKHPELGEEHDVRLFVQKRIEDLKKGNAAPLPPEKTPGSTTPPQSRQVPDTVEETAP